MSDIQINANLSIPEAELTFSASRSSGAGGQHVNTTSSRVTLRFDVANSPSLTGVQRSMITEALSGYIDKAGVLSLHCDSSRSQHTNKQECIERFAAMLKKALIPRKKRTPTKPGRAAKERRIQTKKHRADIKKGRGKVSY